MKSGISWRIATITFVLGLGLLFFTPNVVNIKWWPTKDRIHYGLDIQGGLYLVMGVEVQSVLRESTERLSKTLLAEGKEKNVNLISADRDKSSPDSYDIHVKAASASD